MPTMVPRSQEPGVFEGSVSLLLYILQGTGEDSFGAAVPLPV